MTENKRISGLEIDARFSNSDSCLLYFAYVVLRILMLDSGFQISDLGYQRHI